MPIIRGTASEETFGTLTSTLAGLIVHDPSIGTTEVFGSALVSPQTLSLTGIISTETLGTLETFRKLHGGNTTEQFGTTIITFAAGTLLLPQGLISTEAFGNATVTGGVALTLVGIPDAISFGTAIIVLQSIQFTIQQSGIVTTELIEPPTVSVNIPAAHGPLMFVG